MTRNTLALLEYLPLTKQQLVLLMVNRPPTYQSMS